MKNYYVASLSPEFWTSLFGHKFRTEVEDDRHT